MKKLLTILFICFYVSANSQPISIDSLTKMIKTMQAQIAVLQKYDTLLFTPGQLTLTRNTPTKQTVTINNYAAFLASSNSYTALTAALTAAQLRITILETSLKALQTKVAGLKATSITTTVIK